MSRPWMPLYVADYLRDTRKLSAAEHGAYLLLIMEYWTAGALPDDDAQLARISSMTAGEWKRARPNIEGFFYDGWKHKRLDAELAKSADISSKRAASAMQRHSKSNAIAEQKHTHARASPQSQSQEDGGVEREREREGPASGQVSKSQISSSAFTTATAVLVAMNLHPEHQLSYGAPLTVQGWFNAGWTIECILAGVKRGMVSRNGDPPTTLKYFEKAIARAHAELTASVPVVVNAPGATIHAEAHHRARPETLSDVARRHAASGVGFGPKPTGIPADLEGGATVRLLSQE